MAKHKTPLLDQLESGPWPSFVSDIKQEIEHRYANPKGVDFQVPAECPDDLLGLLELSYVDGETHSTLAKRRAQGMALFRVVARGTGFMLTETVEFP